MREQVIHRILDTKLIAIVRGLNEEKIIPLAEALYNGGIRLIEVTFDQQSTDNFAGTLCAIKAIGKHFTKNEVYAGAGTVITIEQLNMAYDAGSQYIISPNTDAALITKTRELTMVSMPGAMTAGECVAAVNAGADFVKLFPAGELGANYLKALRAPLSGVRFVCVGGITTKNISAFINAGAMGFGIGGNLVNKEWIANNEFNKITKLAKEFTQAVQAG